MFQNNTPGLLSTFRACVDWIGNLRAENESLNDDLRHTDALRIASLEAANADLSTQLRQTQIKSMVWQVKAEDLQDKLDNMAELWAADIPLIEYGRRQKANRARYDAKRRGK